MESPRQKKLIPCEIGGLPSRAGSERIPAETHEGCVVSILSENLTHRHVPEDLSVDDPLANVSEEAADAHSKQPYGDCSRIVHE